MYINMQDWSEIRRHVLVQGLSERAACRKFDLNWSTLGKIPDVPSPLGYRATQRIKRKLGAFLPVINPTLEEDRSVPPK